MAEPPHSITIFRKLCGAEDRALELLRAGNDVRILNGDSARRAEHWAWLRSRLLR